MKTFALLLLILGIVATQGAFQRIQYTGNGLGTNRISTSVGSPRIVSVVSGDSTTHISLLFMLTGTETYQVGTSKLGPVMFSGGRIDVGNFTGLESLSQQGINNRGKPYIMVVHD